MKKSKKIKYKKNNFYFYNVLAYGFAIVSVGILLAIVGHSLKLQKNRKIPILNQNSSVPISVKGPSPTSVKAPSPTIFIERNFEKRIAHNLGVIFKYPDNWINYPNGTSVEQIKQLNLPVQNIAGEAFEIVTDNNGCTLYIAAKTTGGDGPSENVTVDELMIGGEVFVRRSWYHEGSTLPFFNYYFFKKSSQRRFDAIWTFVPEGNAVACQDQINQIFSTFKFVQ